MLNQLSKRSVIVNTAHIKIALLYAKKAIVVMSYGVIFYKTLCSNGVLTTRNYVYFMLCPNFIAAAILAAVVSILR